MGWRMTRCWMVPLVDVGFGTMCWLTWLDVGDVDQGLAKDDRGMVCRRRPSSVGGFGLGCFISLSWGIQICVLI